MFTLIKKLGVIYPLVNEKKKAFDSVDRVCLWEKLLSAGIGGKVFDVIFNMYKGAVLCQTPE